MFLGRVTDWTSVVGTPIPFATVKNTNTKIVNNNGVLSLKRNGIWDVDASLVLTGLADNGVIITVLADGNETGAYAEATTTADGFVTVPIVDAIQTALASYPNVATLQLLVDTAGVTVSGTLRVQYLQ